MKKRDKKTNDKQAKKDSKLVEESKEHEFDCPDNLQSLKTRILHGSSFPPLFEKHLITPFFGRTSWNNIKHVFWALYNENGFPELSEGEKTQITKRVQDRLQYGLRGKTIEDGPQLDPAVIDPYQWTKLKTIFGDIVS